MKVNIGSPCKINLSLRITSKRNDGFHDIHSLFLKIPSIEMLTINKRNIKNVNDIVITRNFDIKGKNIISKILEISRSKGVPIPPLEIEIYKNVPPGTGLGAGSGNAAAFLLWLYSNFSKAADIEPEIIGSDVPFLAGNAEMAVIKGRGELLYPISGDYSHLRTILFIPEWRSNTREAYCSLDSMRCEMPDYFIQHESQIEDEIAGICDHLEREKRYGLLPNDFLPCLESQHPEYRDLFSFLSETNAIAWGVTGSGSAAFAIYSKKFELSPIEAAEKLFNWLEQIIVQG